MGHIATYTAAYLVQQLYGLRYSEWGAMLNSGRELLLKAPWVMTFPGLAIFIVALGLNLLGDGLRDALDPRRVTVAA